MRMGAHDKNQCDRCGHYEWAHGAHGCTAAVLKKDPGDPGICPCPDSYENGVFTRADVPDSEVFPERVKA